MSRLFPVLLLFALSTAWADTIILVTGDSFKGDFFGATSQEIRFVVDGRMMLFQTAAVELIRFGDGPVPEAKPAEEPPPDTAAAPSLPPPSVEPEPGPEPEPEPEAEPQPEWTSAPAPEPVGSQQPRFVGAGTALHVKLLQEVEMGRDDLGTTYPGALEKAVRLTNEKGKPVAIPAGAEVQLRLADRLEIKDSETATTLEATALRYRGHVIPIRTGKGFRQPMSTKEKAKGGLAKAAATLGRSLGGMAGRTATTGVEDTVGEVWEASTRIPAGEILEFLLIEGVNVSWPDAPGPESTPEPERFVTTASAEER